MTHTHRLSPHTILRALCAAGVIALSGCLSAQPLPTGGFAEATGGDLPDTQIGFSHFKSICIDAGGDEAAAINAMRRLNFVVLQDAIVGKFASRDYQLAADLSVTDGEVTSCSLRIVTQSPANEIADMIAPFNGTTAAGPFTAVSAVSYLDGSSPFGSLEDTARMNSNELKVITVSWFSGT